MALIKARSAQSSIETNVNTPSVHHAARAGRLVAGRSAAGGCDSVNFASLPGLTRYHFHSYAINTAITKANDPTIPTLIMNGIMNRNQRSYGMPSYQQAGAGREHKDGRSNADNGYETKL